MWLIIVFYFIVGSHF